MALVLCLLIIGAGSGEAQAQPEDEYARVTKRSIVLERAGEHARAAAQLEAIRSRYPQDFALQLRLAWLHFRAEHYELAERGYRRALALTPSSWEASLGLAWTRLRQGDRAAARAQFQSVLRQLPKNPSALEGLALSREPAALRLDPSLGTSLYSYQGHPTRSWGLAVTLSLPLVIREQLLLAASYRLQYFTVKGQQGQGRGGRSGFSQHEVYLSAGLVRPTFGVIGQYAYLDDGSGYTPRAHVAGLSARYSPWGDLLLAGNVALYHDMTVARLAPAWRMPLRPWLLLTPGLALQLASADQAHDQLDDTTEVLVTGSLSLALVGAAGSLWIGGKLGDEVRPADLDLPVIYNIPERVLFGGWVGGRLSLGGGWSLRAAYQLARLEARPVGQYADSNLHLVSVGVAWSPSQPRSQRR